jgi:hypothetical protein
LQRLEVAQRISPAFGNRDNVVYLPAHTALLAVRFSTELIAEHVTPVFSRVSLSDCRCLAPHGINGLFAKRTSFYSRTAFSHHFLSPLFFCLFFCSALAYNFFEPRPQLANGAKATIEMILTTQGQNELYLIEVRFFVIGECFVELDR